MKWICFEVKNLNNESENKVGTMEVKEFTILFIWFDVYVFSWFLNNSGLCCII